jgi:D-alanyl-D-alanine carboxypeptidase
MAIFRSSHLFVTYAQESGERGYFLAFGREQKRKLYVKGNKFMDYYAEDPNFKGRFYKNASVNNEKEYEEKKYKNLMETDKKFKAIAVKSYSTHKAMLKLNVEKGMGQREIGKIFGVSQVTVLEMIREYNNYVKDD